MHQELYDGNLLAWKKDGSRFRVVMYAHLELNVLELACFDSTQKLESPRLYFSVSTFIENLDGEVLESNLASEKEWCIRHHKQYLPQKFLRQKAFEDMKNLILKRLDFRFVRQERAADISHTASCDEFQAFLSFANSDSPALRYSQCNPPKQFHPTPIQFMETIMHGDSETVINLLRKDCAELGNATSLAELAASSQDGVERMLRERERAEQRHRAVRRRWRKAAHCIMARNMLPKVKARLRRSELWGWYLFTKHTATRLRRDEQEQQEQGESSRKGSLSPSPLGLQTLRRSSLSPLRSDAGAATCIASESKRSMSPYRNPALESPARHCFTDAFNQSVNIKASPRPVPALIGATATIMTADTREGYEMAGAAALSPRMQKDLSNLPPAHLHVQLPPPLLRSRVPQPHRGESSTFSTESGATESTSKSSTESSIPHIGGSSQSRGDSAALLSLLPLVTARGGGNSIKHDSTGGLYAHQCKNSDSHQTSSGSLVMASSSSYPLQENRLRTGAGAGILASSRDESDVDGGLGLQLPPVQSACGTTAMLSPRQHKRADLWSKSKQLRSRASRGKGHQNQQQQQQQQLHTQQQQQQQQLQAHFPTFIVRANLKLQARTPRREEGSLVQSNVLAILSEGND